MRVHLQSASFANAGDIYLVRRNTGQNALRYFKLHTPTGAGGIGSFDKLALIR